MFEKFLPIIRSANLDIIEFDHHKRNHLQNIGRKLPCCIMSYLKRGKAFLRIHNEVHTLLPGSIVLIPVNVFHDHYTEGDDCAEFLWWHFTYTTVGNVDIFNLFDFPSVVHVENTQSFEKLFADFLGSIQYSATLADIIYAKGSSYHVFSYLMKNFMRESNMVLNKAIPPVFFNILYDVSSEYTSNLTLVNLSDKYHLNPTYISNGFKKYFGVTPIFVHKESKLQAAKDLLISTNLSIGEIAQRLGFEYSSAFVRFFSQKTRQSPSGYRAYLNTMK